MNKYLVPVILIYSLQSPAVIVSGEPSNNLRSLKNTCREMAGNYITDIAEVNRLYLKLKDLAGHGEISDSAAVEIHHLVEEIKFYSARIRFDSKPEWNSENVDIEIVWKIPFSLFYDDGDYLRLKKSRDRSDRIQASLGKSSFLTAVNIQKTWFLNAENTEVEKYLSFKPFIFDSHLLDRDRNFFIGYKKAGTLLEVCQFLTSLVFQLEVKFNQTLLNHSYQDQRSLFLIYQDEEDQDAI